MELEIKTQKDTMIVKVVGELDHSNCEKIREKIDDALAVGKAKNVLFDFTGLDFMDSSGIGIIIGRYKKALMKNGMVRIVGMKPQVERIYEICGLQRIVPCSRTIKDALGKM